MQTPQDAADAVLQRVTAIDDGDDQDVLRLEELLRAQTKRAQQLEMELRRRERLLRQLTAQLSAVGPLSGEGDLQGADERRAWTKRAVEAEAARVDMMLRLDAVQGRLSLLEASAQDSTVLQKALADAESVATAVRFRAVELERQLRKLQQERNQVSSQLRERGAALTLANEQLANVRGLAATAREELQASKRRLVDIEREHAAERSGIEASLSEKHTEELRQVERRLALSEDKVSELGQMLSEARLQADAALAREDTARAELAELRKARAAEADVLAKARASEASAHAASAELQALRERLAGLEQELALRTSEIAQHSEAGATLQREVEAVRAALAGREQALQQAQQALEAGAERLASMERDQELAQAELEQSRAKLAALAEAAASGAQAPADDDPSPLGEGATDEADEDEAGEGDDSVIAPEDSVAIAQRDAALREVAALKAQLGQAHQLLQRLRDGLEELAHATIREGASGQVATATLAGHSDAASSFEDEPAVDQRLLNAERSLEEERQGRGEDRREARRQIHALKTECQVMRARFDDEHARVQAAMVAVQGLQQDLLPGDPLYGRVAELLIALEGGG